MYLCGAPWKNKGLGFANPIIYILYQKGSIDGGIRTSTSALPAIRVSFKHAHWLQFGMFDRAPNGASYTIGSVCPQVEFSHRHPLEYLKDALAAESQDGLVRTHPGNTRFMSNLYIITQTLGLPKGSLQVHITLLSFEAFLNLPISSNWKISLLHTEKKKQNRIQSSCFIYKKMKKVCVRAKTSGLI